MCPSMPLTSSWRARMRRHQDVIPGTGQAAVVLAFIAMGLTATEARDFIVTDSQPAGHPTIQALVYMDRLVRDRTQGRHRITVHHAGTLGEQRATFEQTRLGAIDINRTNMAPLTSFIGEVNVLGLPFLFRSADHLHKVLDGPIGEEILQRLEPHGFVGLAFYDSGARSVYTAKRLVRKLGDLEGLRIRLQQSDLMIEIFRALGAEPVLLPYILTKTGLATDLIDAAENNWPSYILSGHYTVARHYTLTEHSMTPDVLVMSSKTWNSLSAEDRQTFRDAARESRKFMRSQWKKWQEGFRKQAPDLGVSVVEIDRKPLEAALTGVYELLLDSRLRLLVNRSEKRSDRDRHWHTREGIVMKQFRVTHFGDGPIRLE
jgi:tripartite ATP-independent transporter DctP family solute receptor